MTFEPYHDGTYPVGGEWQEWDTLSMRGWWGSAAPLNTTCPQSAPCTLAEVVDAFPNSGINPGDSQVVFKAGSGWTGGFDGNVDAFSIGTADGTTTYDFEAEAPVVVPTDPETRTDCMKGGWEAYGFKNQGQCNQFVNTGFDSR